MGVPLCAVLFSEVDLLGSSSFSFSKHFKYVHFYKARGSILLPKLKSWHYILFSHSSIRVIRTRGGSFEVELTARSSFTVCQERFTNLWDAPFGVLLYGLLYEEQFYRSDLFFTFSLNRLFYNYIIQFLRLYTRWSYAIFNLFWPSFSCLFEWDQSLLAY